MAPFEDYLHSDTIANVALLQRSQDLLTDKYCTEVEWRVARDTGIHRSMLCWSVVYGKFSSLFV